MKRERESVSFFSGGKEAIKQTQSRRTAVETLGHVTHPDGDPTEAEANIRARGYSVNDVTDANFRNLVVFISHSGAEVQLKPRAVSPRSSAAADVLPGIRQNYLCSIKNYTHL